MSQLLALPTKDKSVNVAVEVGRRYSNFGMVLLNDAKGVVVDALEHERHWNAESINMEILKRWLQGMGAKPVIWSTLVRVLREIGM